MPIINYKTGQERDIIRERKGFDESIFKDQYRRAVKILGDNVKDIEKDAPKVITFCGDRGDGKTSCLCSVLEILKRISPRHRMEGYEDYGDGKEEFEKVKHFVEKYGDRILLDRKYLVTDLVDPSFFDKSHNVLDIIIGQMYNEYRNVNDEECDYEFQDSVSESFQEVKRRLSSIYLNRSDSKRNDIQDLNDLAASIELKKSIGKLVKRYLKYMRRDVLIIPVDDIDLALLEAYDMCEQIRKYLCVPGCIVMMCVKVPQLQEVIRGAFLRDMNEKPSQPGQKDNENPVMSEWDLKAKKYIDKLLPVSSRIDMPKAYSLEDIKISVDSDDEVKSMSTGILEMIFKRTRYLFYNPAGGISPIIPNNLRELFNLVGLLASMKPVMDSRGSDEEKETLKANKRLFKNYFFTVWKDRFDADTQETLDNLLNYDFGTSFNREVVKILNNHFNNRLKKDYDYTPENEESEAKENLSRANQKTNPSKSDARDIVQKTDATIMFESITSNDAFGYNITIGDVFYLFSRLEKETLSEGGYALVFFLKSYYSILLYEAYEHITENDKQIYPAILPENKGLTVIDSRLDHTNRLQQLIGGSYFTYVPGELLPTELDLRIVNGSAFNKLLSDVKEKFRVLDPIINKKKEELTAEEVTLLDELNKYLNIAELFILQTKCAVRMKHESDRDKTVPEHLAVLRSNVEAFHYRSFYPSTGYYMLDVTAPFANIVNPEFAYKRFSVIDEDLYQKILKYPDSILYRMIQESAHYRDHINYKEDKERENYHRLLSVSVIRNAEVLTAIKENIIRKRKSSQANRLTALQEFYKNIKESEMSTHTTGDEPYQIVYHFLSPIQNLMDELAKTNWQSEKATIFKQIFQLDGKDIKEAHQEEASKALKNSILNLIKFKKRNSAIAKDIISITRFNGLDEERLAKFVENTLKDKSKKAKKIWLDNNLESLIAAIDNPQLLDTKDDGEAKIEEVPAPAPLAEDHPVAANDKEGEENLQEAEQPENVQLEENEAGAENQPEIRP